MGAYCRHGVIAGNPCGYCKQDLAKDARIAELEAALDKAEDALVYFQEDHGCCPVCARYIKDRGHTNGCLYSEALAAIKEARND